MTREVDRTPSRTIRARRSSSTTPCRPGIVKPDFPIPVENLVWMQQQLVELGQITKSGGVEQAVNNEHPRRGAAAHRQVTAAGGGDRGRRCKGQFDG